MASHPAREIPGHARLCTLMVHTPSHNAEELQLNPEIFTDLAPGDFIQIYDPQNCEGYLVLKVPAMPPLTSRMEISLTKVIADANNLKSFAKVVVEKINAESAMIDFVELAFKRQYLQRGNFFRFQREMIGRPIYLNQTVSINGIQAQIQDLRKDYDTKRSGIISERTKLVFRSRSARIIWLVQISAEMWEFDQNGDLYFEKFLRDFVSPLLDKWRNLGVSHMLTVVFFSRTLFLERVTSNYNPELYSKRSFGQSTDGFQYQDNFKIVIENIAEFDQTTQINRLRQEFWDYPRRLGWRVPQHLLHAQRSTANAGAGGSGTSQDALPAQHPGGASDAPSSPPPLLSSASTGSSITGQVSYAVPSDAVHGNFLEAINMSLNILSKHYLDRDLVRTNNSIVMVSAGTGVFKVRPNLNQITKQRMLDNAFGIDFISLARPIVDTVPLFLVDCRNENVKNFYETPHWMRVSYIDCQKEVSEALEAIHKESKTASSQGESDDALWGKRFMLQPTTSLLTAQLENCSDLKQLAAAYAHTLPLPLREVMAMNVLCPLTGGSLAQPHLLSREASTQSAVGLKEDGADHAEKPTDAVTSPAHSTNNKDDESLHDPLHDRLPDPELEALLNTGVPPIPTWGAVSSIPFLNQVPAADGSGKRSSAISAKNTIMMEDLLTLKSFVLSSMATEPGKGAAGNMMKGKLREVIEDLPMLQRDRGESIAESLGTTIGDSTDEDSEHGHHRPTGKFITGSSYEDDERMRAYERQAHHPAGSSVAGSRHIAQSMESSSVGDCSYLSDLLRPIPSGQGQGQPAKTISAPAALQALVEDLHGRQKTLRALSTAEGAMTREKLLELMSAHDKNIFKVRTAPTGAHVPIGTLGDSQKSTATSASTVQHGKGASPAVHVHPPSKGDHMDTTTAPVAAAEGVHHQPPSSAEKATVSAAGPESTKKTEQVSREEALRAKLLASSNSHQPAARQKQMLAMQAQSPLAPHPSHHSVGGVHRALGAVHQQHLRAQQQHGGPGAGVAAGAMAGAGGSGHVRSPSAELTATPTKGINVPHDSEGNGDHGKSGIGEGVTKGVAVERSVSDPESTVASRSGTSSSAEHSPSHSSLASGKKYQRLNNRSFMGTKSLAALGATLAKPTPEALARARAANPNQQFIIVHGKIVPINTHADSDAKQKSEQYAQYIRDYSQTHCVNPFRIRDSQSYSQSQSYNRRRWVHVFPQTKSGRGVDYSLNWKSLTQPAILPLTTDFVPSIKMLDTKYNVSSSYQLFVGEDSPFATAEDLMKELICLRLTQEYQLIEDFDPTIYRRFNNTAEEEGGGLSAGPVKLSLSASANKRAPNILLGNGPSLRRMDSVHSASREMRNFYILSMGHRIQFIQYDDKGVNVTIYRSREGEIQDDEKSVYGYSYESWNPHVGAFITMSQSFHKFSSEEFRWNKLDNVVVGNIPADTYEEAMKMKRLKYTILPPEIYTEDEANEYYAKIAQLVEFLNKYTVGSEDKVAIFRDGKDEPAQVLDWPWPRGPDTRRQSFEKARSSSSAGGMGPPGMETGASVNSFVHLYPQTPHSMALYRRTDARNCDTAKMIVRTSKQGNPAWLYCRYDKVAYTYKALHLEFHWVVCDSWLIDDMLNVLYRRCLKWGLRVCQVPQYYSKEDLNVHPFRALPYLPVAKTQREVPGVYPSALRMVEKFLFSRPNGWLFENEYRTDWTALAMAVPTYLDRDRDLLALETAPMTLDTAVNEAAGTLTPTTPSVAGETTPKPSTLSSLTQSFSRMVMGKPEESTGTTGSSSAASNQPRPVPVPFRKPASTRRVDRQYTLSNGLAAVRVAAQGFLWMQNTASKVSDVNLSMDERRDLVARNLASLTQACERVPLCYDICIELVEAAMEAAQQAQVDRILETFFAEFIAPFCEEVVPDALEEVRKEVEEEEQQLAAAAAQQDTEHPPSSSEGEGGPQVALSPNPEALGGADPPAFASPVLSDTVGIAMDSFRDVHSVKEKSAEPLQYFAIDAAVLDSSDSMLRVSSSDGLAVPEGEPSIEVRKGRAWTAASFMSSPTATPHTPYSEALNSYPDGGSLPEGSSQDPFPLFSRCSEDELDHTGEAAGSAPAGDDEGEGEGGMINVASATSLTLSSISSAVVSPLPEGHDAEPATPITPGAPLGVAEVPSDSP